MSWQGVCGWSGGFKICHGILLPHPTLSIINILSALLCSQITEFLWIRIWPARSRLTWTSSQSGWWSSLNGPAVQTFVFICFICETYRQRRGARPVCFYLSALLGQIAARVKSGGYRWVSSLQIVHCIGQTMKTSSSRRGKTRRHRRRHHHHHHHHHHHPERNGST